MTSTKLKNGMRVHLVPVVGTEATTVLALVKVGSRYENDAVWGGSHFIEHLMFKGTEKRPTTLDISKTLDRYGAQYNAYTGKDITGYWVKIEAGKLPVAVDLLADMMFFSKYDPEEMEREKQVIIEEIKMYEENPIMHLDDLLEDALFEGTRLGKNIAGTAKSMLDMKREDVIAYRDEYYTPERTVIVIAGKVDESILETLESTFGTVNTKADSKNFAPVTLESRTGRKVGLQTKPVEQIQFGLAFPMVGKDHPDLPAIGLLSTILGGAMSSRLFVEVRERRGLCYTIRSSAETYEDVGMFTVRAGLDAKRLSEAAKVIFAELEKMKTEGVTEEELQYAKDHIEGSLNLSLEDSADMAEFYGKQELFLQKIELPSERVAKYRAVTREDVRRVANEIFDTNRMAVAGIGPYDSKEALLNEIGLS